MVYYFEGRKVAVFLEGTLEGILDFKASTAMRAAYRLAFSLMVKVPATIATGALVCGSPETDMSCHFPYCPCEHFGAYGGQLLIGSCHLFFYFRSCLHSSMP